MGKLKEISKHPLASALAAAMTTVGGALSAVGVFPASPDLEGRFWWLAAWFGTTVALGTWSYFTWHLRWRLLTGTSMRPARPVSLYIPTGGSKTS